jgi:hypothetical protein
VRHRNSHDDIRLSPDKGSGSGDVELGYLRRWSGSHSGRRRSSGERRARRRSSDRPEGDPDDERIIYEGPAGLRSSRMMYKTTITITDWSIEVEREGANVVLTLMTLGCWYCVCQTVTTTVHRVRFSKTMHAHLTLTTCYAAG